jgi:small-conductance mechanosensitive channel
MTADSWQALLAGALALNAALGFGYRVYRLTKGGPMGDVVGQAILGLVLGGVALAVAADVGWAKWVALGYGVLFGVLVMPIWVLAVLLPLRPNRIDYAFTALYWLMLGVIVIAAIAV